MAGRYSFESVGAAMGQGIQQELMRREIRQRQAMLDAEAIRAREAQERDRQEARMIQADQLTRQRKADEVEQARRIVEESWKGDRPDEATQALLTRSGYGGAMRMGEGTTAEFMGQDPSTGQDFYSAAVPGVMEMRGGAKWLNNQILEEGRLERAAAAAGEAAARQQTQIDAAAARQREIERAADEARVSNQRHQETLATIRAGAAGANRTQPLPRELDQTLTTLAGQGANRDQVSRYVYEHWAEISQKYPDITGERMSAAIEKMFNAPRGGI